MAEKEDDSVGVETTPPPVNGGGPQVEMKMRGSADQIKAQLAGDRTHVEKPPKKTPSEALADALKVPTNIVRVKRQAPQRDADSNVITGEVWRAECPISLGDIEAEIEKNFGGRKFRVSVEDSKTGDTIAATQIEINAEPKLMPGDLDELFGPPPRQGRRNLGWGNPLGMVDPELAKADKEIALAEKDEELAKRRKRLAELLGNGASLTDPVVAALQAKVAAMEAGQLDTARRENERLRAELAAKQSAPPAESETMKMLLRMMDQQAAAQKAADEKFERMIARQSEDKLAAVLAEVKALREKPTQAPNDMLAQVVALKKLMSALKGDDEDDDEEPKEWWELLIKEHLPRVFDLIEDKAKNGKALTKEEVIAEMNLAADRAVRDFQPPTPTVQQRPAALPLPAPAPAPILQAPPPVAGGIPEPKVTVVTPASAPAPVLNLQPDAKPVPAPAPAPPPAPEMISVEQEIAFRVTRFLIVVEREMSTRQRGYEWPAIAWESLPEDLLEIFSSVATPDAIPSVFAGILKPEKIAEMSEQMKAPKVSAFLQRGLDELKGWLIAAKEDPSFDPFEEEEDPQAVQP